MCGPIPYIGDVWVAYSGASARTQRSSVCASGSVIPLRGRRVHEQRGAFARGRPRVTGVVERVIDPRQRPTAGIGFNRVELPMGVGEPHERSKLRWGNLGRPSRWGRYSLAFSSQPLAHASWNAEDSPSRCSAALDGRKCGAILIDRMERPLGSRPGMGDLEPKQRDNAVDVHQQQWPAWLSQR